MPLPEPPPEERPRRHNWCEILGFAAALAVIALAADESAWRAAGYRPSVPNGPDLWAYHRRHLPGNDPTAVAVLGSSRMLTDFATDVFRERFPRRHLAQLALPTSSPVYALHQLAEDRRFCGLVICEFYEATFVTALSEKYSKREIVRLAESKPSSAVDCELWVAGKLQEMLCCRGEDLRLRRLISAGVDGGAWPAPRTLLTRFDRRELADYRAIDVDAARKITFRWMMSHCEESASSFPTHAEWLKQVLRTEADVEAIQSRGGRVVFVRLPTKGELWESENKYFPKEKCWDRFARATSAVAVHFQDVPSLARIDCPDTAHLDFRDAGPFTAGLLDELQKRGVLGTAGSGRGLAIE